MDEPIEELRRKVNNYRQTVQALVALAHELRYDDSARRMHRKTEAYLGRRMDTSGQNPVCPNDTVTPDLVVERGDGYRAVAEAKLGLPADPGHRGDDLRQVSGKLDCLIRFF